MHFYDTYCILLSLLIFYRTHFISGASMEDTESLLTDLFKNYSTEVRPVIDQDRPVNVQVDVTLSSIKEFNEITGVISLAAVLYISWTDESLIWTPSTYGNLTSITFNQRNIWLPQMYLGNAADKFEPISNKHFKVRVMSNGTVLWRTGGILKFTCTPDMSMFPFDLQTCPLMIIAWGYSHTEVTLSIPSSVVDLTNFSQSVEWIVTGSSTELWIGQFDIALFYFNMERRPLNFLVNVVLPIILLSLVNPFVFILPYNSGERASYSLTVLLSFSVYMTVVSDRMPASSAPMSYLSYYLFCMLTLSAFIVEVNLCQMRTYNKNEDDEPIPIWIRSLVQKLRIRFGRRIENDSNNLSREDKTCPHEQKKKTEAKFEIERLESVKEKDGVLMASPEHQGKGKILFGAVSGSIGQSSLLIQEDKLKWHDVGKFLDKIYFVVFHVVNAILLIIFIILLL